MGFVVAWGTPCRMSTLYIYRCVDLVIRHEVLTEPDAVLLLLLLIYAT